MTETISKVKKNGINFICWYRNSYETTFQRLLQWFSRRNSEFFYIVLNWNWYFV